MPMQMHFLSNPASYVNNKYPGPKYFKTNK